MDVKNRKKAIITLWILMISALLYRTWVVAIPHFQEGISISFSDRFVFVFFIISVTVSVGVIILTVNVTNFILSMVIVRIRGLNLEDYQFKNVLYAIYLSGFSLSNLIIIIISFSFKVTTTHLIMASLISYLAISIMLSISLRKIIGLTFLNIQLSSLMFIGNSITVLYMLIRQ